MLSRKSLRIVHIDDDDDFAELGARWLKRAGFQQPIVRCVDGIRAVDYFSTIERGEAPDVILVDLNMPRMNGLGVVHWIRTSYKSKVAVYLLTSSEDPSVLARGVEHGITAYIPKSSMLDQLVKKLDGLIASRNEIVSKSLEE